MGDGSFDEKVLKAQTPVLVDFWGPDCAPCRVLDVAINQLVGEYEGKLTFARVNVYENPRLAIEYGVRSIPTLIFFRDGNPMDQIVGAVPKKVLKKRLDAVLV